MIGWSEVTRYTSAGDLKLPCRRSCTAVVADGSVACNATRTAAPAVPS
jgi:hypothetical protein